MAQVLQLAHFIEHHRVAKMDVRGGGVQSELDSQRLASGRATDQLLEPFGLRNQFVATPQRGGHGRADSIRQR